MAAADYAATLDEAAALAGAGRHAEAMAILTPLQMDYPQDYGLHLQLGWYAYNAGDWQAAKRYYGDAVAISDGAIEALLGLGWTLVEMRERDGAIAAFERLLIAEPRHGGALEGLARARDLRAVSLTPWGALSTQLYGGGVPRDYAVGVAVALPATLGEHALLQATYRFTRVAVSTPAAATAQRFGRRESGSTWYGTQHELHLSAGASFAALGVAAHYSFATERPASTQAAVHIAGASLRLSGWSDLVLEGSYSFYGDVEVLRVAPAWRVPVPGGFAITAVGAVQRFDRSVLGSGALTLTYGDEHRGVHVGGKLGREQRPVYLFQPSIYNISEPMTGGAFAGASLPLSAEWALHLAYEFHRLELSGGGAGGMHLVSLALASIP